MPRPAKTAFVLRNRELAAIHIARQQLGMEDDTYRDMLFAVARVRSAKDLDWRGRKLVIDHLASRGARIGKASVAHKKPNEWGFIVKAAPDCQPLLRKLCVLARNAGHSKAYVEGIAANMDTRIRTLRDDVKSEVPGKVVKPLEFCTADELWRIVNALIAHLGRQKA